MDLNHVFLAGNLTRDPELRNVGEAQVANFGLAVNRRYKTASGEQREEVTFVDCEAWGSVAGVIGQYLKKGSPALVTGRLKLDQWQDRDGQNRSRLKVLVGEFKFVPTGGGNGGVGGDRAPQPRQEQRQHETSYSAADDQPPF